VKLGAACFGHPVSQPTLGPLGLPEKAIGHEPQIEPWLAPDNQFCLSVSERTGVVATKTMKTAGRENPNSRAWLCNEPSKRGGRRETSSLIHRGWKARKIPASGEVFFLTLPFIEPFIELHGTWRRAVTTGRTLGRWAYVNPLDTCALSDSHDFLVVLHFHFAEART
jgi:hypothetical protein